MGQNVIYDSDSFEDNNEALLTAGYHSSINHLSYKLGAMYSEHIGLCGSLGVGFKFY